MSRGARGRASGRPRVGTTGTGSPPGAAIRGCSATAPPAGSRRRCWRRRRGGPSRSRRARTLPASRRRSPRGARGAVAVPGLGPGDDPVAPLAAVKSSRAQMVLSCVSTLRDRYPPHTPRSRCSIWAVSPGSMRTAWVKCSWNSSQYGPRKPSARPSSSGWVARRPQAASGRSGRRPGACVRRGSRSLRRGWRRGAGRARRAARRPPPPARAVDDDRGVPAQRFEHGVGVGVRVEVLERGCSLRGRRARRTRAAPRCRTARSTP
jgi:hypothetical protein